MTLTPKARRPALPRRSRSVLTLGVCLVVAAVVAWGAASLGAAVALSALTPGTATPGVTLQITGTGFAATAADNEVSFTPAADDGPGSPSITAPVASVSLIDAKKDARRLQVVLPAGLPVGAANVRVRNRLTGEIGAGRAVQVVAVEIPQPVVAAPGATGIQVHLVGTGNTLFASGSLAANFGVGVSATALTAVSPTEVVATVRVDRRAPLGPRVVELVTPSLRALVPVGFSVGTAPANRQPGASANGPYTGVAGVSLAVSSAGSSDPDGDPLSYAWRFGDGATSTEPNPSHTWAVAGTYPIELTVSDGRGGIATATTTARIEAAPNHAPRITSTPPAGATEGTEYAYALTADDQDGDPVAFTLLQGPQGMALSGARLTWTPSALQAGGHDVSVQADDGRGGLDTQTFRVQVIALVRLTGIDVLPGTLRFSAPGGSRPLTVTGRRSDGSTIDLTPGAAGTTYESSHPFVARVSTDGVVTAVADGEATVTVRSGGFIAAVPVVVESGVTLDSLDLTPTVTTLRQSGATQALVLRGRFSDQTVRDLTSAPGARFTSSDPRVVALDGSTATAVANGQVTITATVDTLTATATMSVVIAGGTGVLRGEVYDDSRGLPLAGARVRLLEDGGGAPAAPVEGVTDARGRFALAGRAGDVTVRISHDGFTSVDRTGTLASGGVATLLDARLTPLDTSVSAIPPVFGGEAHDTARALTLTVPAGALAADTTIRLTRLSAQGLVGRLPLGWSPVSAADILAGGESASLRFAQAATLRFPNTASFGEGSSVPVARYDETGRRWVAVGPGRVSPDGLGIEVTVAETGQYVALASDTTPFAPADATPGRVLEGVAFGGLPTDAVAAGEVTPRAAPPGEDVRATGRLTLAGPTLFPSGTVVQARVREQFTLTDSSDVTPEPFTQDLLVFGQPRPTGGRLGAAFPITPSRQYTLQELARGVVTIDVTAEQPGGGRLVGASGGVVTTAEGDALLVPPGAAGSDAAADLRRLLAEELGGVTTAGYELLAALDVDLSVALSGSAQLAIPRPSGLADDAQVLVGLRFTDPLGGTRLRLVALGAIEATRIASSSDPQGLALDGVRGTGTYVFLRALSPVAFVTGRVLGLDGLTPHPQVLVTADGSPFADLTGPTGRYVLPAPAGAALQVRLLDTGTRDGATGSTTLAAARTVATLDVALAVVSPFVVAVAPAAGADTVPLDSSVTVTFSEAMDPTSVSDTSLQLRAGAGIAGDLVAAQRTLSADRLRVVLRPVSPLDGRTTYTIVATAALRDLSGNALVPFAGSSFTTLDPSKPPQPAPGQVTAEIPDEDGLTLVVGTPGAAAGGTAVTGTNLRTQDTVTVLALGDGSFRFRIGAIVGDEIALTFRDGSGRETTVTLSQFGVTEGPAGIGLQGGTIRGAGDRVGTILPRALSTAGLFSLTAPNGLAAGPALPSGLAYVDRFRFSPGSAQFSRLASLTLSESQNRFPAQTATAPVFAADGTLVVPPDFLTNATVRFTAIAQDTAGNRQTVTGTTTVVAGSPDGQLREIAQLLQFPTLTLTAPRESQPNQQLRVSAVAPAARVDLSLPSAPSTETAATLLLARVVDVDGQPRLAVVDRLEVTGTGTGTGAARRLRTSGRDLPGLSAGGDYVVVASTEPLVFATGRANGPAAVVGSDDLPFVFETGGPNASFAVPVRAGQPFTLRFTSAGTGTPLGEATGTAPASGAVNVGSPLAGAVGALAVTATPDDATLVDIGTPITWTFTEAVDSISLSNAVLVTDAAGNRVFGRLRRCRRGDSAGGLTLHRRRQCQPSRERGRRVLQRERRHPGPHSFRDGRHLGAGRLQPRSAGHPHRRPRPAREPGVAGRLDHPRGRDRRARDPRWAQRRHRHRAPRAWRDGRRRRDQRRAERHDCRGEGEAARRGAPGGCDRAAHQLRHAGELHRDDQLQPRGGCIRGGGPRDVPGAVRPGACRDLSR